MSSTQPLSSVSLESENSWIRSCGSRKPLPLWSLTRESQIVGGSGCRVHAYAEEASTRFGWSAEMLAEVQSRVGDTTTVQHVRIGAAHSPIPSSRDLERQSLPQVDDIVHRILESF